MAEDFLFPQAIQAGSVAKTEGGLTKREYFALQILLSKPNQSNHYVDESIKQADDLLKGLNKGY